MHPPVGSAIPVRSVNECFYGERWVPQDRISVLEHAAEAGANAYVYGPSADRRTGGLWRDRYDGVEGEVLADFATAARALGVEPIWRVSPSAPLEPERGMRLTDPEDLAELVGKIDSVFALGFERVLIAFDDLTHGLDAQAAEVFADAAHPLAAAHAAVVRAVGEAVGHHRLIVCPLHYWGAEPSSYRRAFGAGFPAEVPVIWTGRAVISDEITAREAQGVADELGHPLWLWDNYPVNDWDMDGIGADVLHVSAAGLDNLVTPRRLPLAPLRARDAALAGVLQGMGANLALDPWTGIPAASTLLAFAADPVSYDPDLAWRRAVERLDTAPDALAVLADAAGPGSGAPIAAPSSLARACGRVLAEGPEPGVLHALEEAIASHVDALVTLRARPSRLTWELRPWLVELGRQCHLVSLAVAALRSSGEERGDLVVALRGALLHASTVSVASGAGRALAEYARGMMAGGTPAIDVPPHDRGIR
ncbi:MULTISPECIES: beta-N-acetylglucosaminidase domain-containing protein [Microbacterium]|uniref:beta-N-acetylglucosaminidase domain-containing protein n=1 Tax=Microbacterium TaxID=33882 RepID=UPI00300FB4ED